MLTGSIQDYNCDYFELFVCCVSKHTLVLLQCRRFIVYPSYCVWPTSLITMALNNAPSAITCGSIYVSG